MISILFPKKRLLRKNRVSTVFSLILILLSSIAIASGNAPSQCEKDGWCSWNSSVKKYVCISTGSSVQTPQDLEKCKNNSVHGLTNALGGAASSNELCGSLPPSNSYLQCPKQLLQQLVLSDNSGVLFGLVGSPNAQCKEKLDQDFKTPADLEKFLAASPKYSVGAAPEMLSMGCLSDFGTFRAVGSPMVKASPSEAKQAIASYYYLSDRLNRGSQGTLESIASIDSIIGHKPLENVTCSEYGPYLNKPVQWCEQFQKKSCTAQGGLDDLTRETLSDVQIYDKAVMAQKLITDYPAGLPLRERANPELSEGQKAQYAAIENLKAAILSQYPWIDGSEFRLYLKQHGASTLKKAVGKDDHPEYNLQVIHDALYGQLTKDRDGALQRLKRFQRASSCLNQKFFDVSHCRDFDSIIGETPLQNNQDLAGMNAECRFNVAKSNEEDHKLEAEVASTVPLIFLTGGGSLAAEFVGIASAVPAVVQAFNTCQSKLITLDKPANDPSTQIFCPAKAGVGIPGAPNAAAKQISDCVIASALAGASLLPIATPAMKKLIGAAASESKGVALIAESTEDSATIEGATTKVSKDVPVKENASFTQQAPAPKGLTTGPHPFKEYSKVRTSLRTLSRDYARLKQEADAAKGAGNLAQVSELEQKAHELETQFFSLLKDQPYGSGLGSDFCRSESSLFSRDAKAANDTKLQFENQSLSDLYNRGAQEVEAATRAKYKALAEARVKAAQIAPNTSGLEGVKDYTKLRGYGLTDDQRLARAEQDLHDKGLLTPEKSLTAEQKELLKNHLNDPGAIEPSYGEHTSEQLRTKLKKATNAAKSNVDRGFNQAQADYLIREGYAGVSGPINPLIPLTDVEVIAAMSRKQAYIAKSGLNGNPTSLDASEVVRSVDGRAQEILDNAAGGSAQTANIRGALMGETAASTKKATGIFSMFKPKADIALSPFARAAKGYAEAVSTHLDPIEAVRQKIILNRLFVQKLKDLGRPDFLIQDVIQKLTEMGTY